MSEHNDVGSKGYVAPRVRELGQVHTLTQSLKLKVIGPPDAHGLMTFSLGSTS
jgi:hypothetical protein